MFYCEACRIKRDWPEGFLRSYGPCELCGKMANCHDVPSRFLPIPQESAR